MLRVVLRENGCTITSISIYQRSPDSDINQNDAVEEALRTHWSSECKINREKKSLFPSFYNKFEEPAIMESECDEHTDFKSKQTFSKFQNRTCCTESYISMGNDDLIALGGLWE